MRHRAPAPRRYAGSVVPARDRMLSSTGRRQRTLGRLDPSGGRPRCLRCRRRTARTVLRNTVPTNIQKYRGLSDVRRGMYSEVVAGRASAPVGRWTVIVVPRRNGWTSLAAPVTPRTTLRVPGAVPRVRVWRDSGEMDSPPRQLSDRAIAVGRPRAPRAKTASTIPGPR